MLLHRKKRTNFNNKCTNEETSKVWFSTSIRSQSNKLQMCLYLQTCKQLIPSYFQFNRTEGEEEPASMPAKEKSKKNQKQLSRQKGMLELCSQDNPEAVV